MHWRIFFVLINLFFLMLISAQESQAANTFTANKIEWFQLANNQTGKCYGPTFKAGVPIYIQIGEISINGEPITAPPQNLPAKGSYFVYRKYLLMPFPHTVNIDQIDPSTGIVSTSLTYDIASNDRLLKIEYVLNSFPFPKQGTLVNERIAIVPENEVDESKCLQVAPEDFGLCEQIPSDKTELILRCQNCFAAGGIWTAIGCVPKDPENTVSVIIRMGLIFGGAIVLIMILAGSFMLSTSQGDPKKTQEAKELITSAIIGLLFIIFSITILQFIGASVIRIPGFGE